MAADGSAFRMRFTNGAVITGLNIRRGGVGGVIDQKPVKKTPTHRRMNPKGTISRTTRKTTN